MKALASLAAALCSAVPAAPAAAHTECPVDISRFFVANDGFVWLVFDERSSAHFYKSAGGSEAMLATATAALAAQLPVVVRYAADGVDCAAGGHRGDIEGLWLLRRR